jgi:hypothetical protein
VVIKAVVTRQAMPKMRAKVVETRATPPAPEKKAEEPTGAARLPSEEFHGM